MREPDHRVSSEMTGSISFHVILLIEVVLEVTLEVILEHMCSGRTGYSWFDGLLRNPRSGVQTSQVLGYSGMRVALNPRSGVQTPTRWSNPPRSGVGVPHVQSGYTLP